MAAPDDCDNVDLSAKIVLLGESGVGKTSLSLRCVRGKFFPYQESTIGAAFVTQIIPLASGKRVKLAGQERYKSLAPMYYRGCSAAIVIYDVTQSPSAQRALSWLQELRRQGPRDVPLFLVANKIDLREDQEVNPADLEENCRSMKARSFTTCAKTGEGVHELFLAVAKSVSDYRTLYDDDLPDRGTQSALSLSPGVPQSGSRGQIVQKSEFLIFDWGSGVRRHCYVQIERRSLFCVERIDGREVMKVEPPRRGLRSIFSRKRWSVRVGFSTKTEILVHSEEKSFVIRFGKNVLMLNGRDPRVCQELNGFQRLLSSLNANSHAKIRLTHVGQIEGGLRFELTPLFVKLTSKRLRESLLYPPVHQILAEWDLQEESTNGCLSLRKLSPLSALFSGFVQALSWSQIRALDLTRTGIGDEEIRLLVNFVPSTLEKLILWWNPITYMGAIEIGLFLEQPQSHSLKELSLASTNIGPIGVKKICRSIARSQWCDLSILNLSDCEIDPTTISDIRLMMTGNQVRELSLENVRHVDGLEEEVAEVLNDDPEQCVIITLLVDADEVREDDFVEESLVIESEPARQIQLVASPFSESQQALQPCQLRKSTLAFVRGSLRLADRWFDHTSDVCYCSSCHHHTAEDELIPVGWVKFGLPISKNAVTRGVTYWRLAYHGTSAETANEIVRSGLMLLSPGMKTRSGVELSPLPNHIQPSTPALQRHVSRVFVSPSLVYASLPVYSPVTVSSDGREFQIVFQVRIQDGTFEVGPETVLKQHERGIRRIDPRLPNDLLEWSTDRQGVVYLVGLMVRECFGEGC